MGSFLESFSRLAADDPCAPALIDGTTAGLTSRAELLRRGQELADWLRRHDLRAGDLVAVQLPNSVDFVASFLASLQCGTTVVPIDRDARESEVGAILAAFGIRALIYRGQPGERYPGLSVRDVEAPPADRPAVPLVKVTSGSTGQPRAIWTSEKNLIADCLNICATMDIRPDDRNLGAIPFSHSYGFSNLVTPLLLQGTAIVVSNDYLPLSILNLANLFHCTVFPGIPMVFDHLGQLPRSDGGFSSVRTFLSAGAPLTAQVSRRFRERFQHSIHSFYGCSECGGIAYDRDGGSVERGTVGRPMAGVRLSIDEQGRLIVRSDAAATADGIFVADDIARFTESGEVELLGRVGDLINIAGKKVNPREVEQVLLQIRGVREVKVYGEPAGARGEVVAAVVVADPDVTREEVRAFCRERLSSHKVPRIVKFIESIPLDERGKVKRSALALL